MIKGFTARRVIQRRDNSKPYYIGRAKHYTWNDEDMVYYNDDVDDDYFMEAPKNGVRTYTMMNNMKARLLVKIDK